MREGIQAFHNGVVDAAGWHQQRQAVQRGSGLRKKVPEASDVEEYERIVGDSGLGSERCRSNYEVLQGGHGYRVEKVWEIDSVCALAMEVDLQSTQFG